MDMTNSTNSSNLSAKILNTRAYAAMYSAEQAFGHGSDAHLVAWMVFCDTFAIMNNETYRTFADHAERTLGIDAVETIAKFPKRAHTQARAIVRDLAKLCK